MCNMKCLLLLVIAISVNGRLHHNNVLGEEWQLFKLQHSKVYSDTFEEHYRKMIYIRNKQDIIKHNKLYELGQVSFKLGLNKYSDLDHSEFAAQMNCVTRSKSWRNSDNYTLESLAFIEPDNDVLLPSSINWKTKGAVTPIKDQGKCGSCWSFATTGVLEGQFFRKTGKLISMSEQNLVDCDKISNGCNGGNKEMAYKYIQNNGGIDTEDSYPYETRQGKCRYNRKYDCNVKVNGYVEIEEGNENALMKAVATVGPIAVDIDASHKSFKFYQQGIYYESECSTTSLTHSVLVVGYGTSNKGNDYWIVKNSWGDDWGDKGYVYMARNKRNNCGIASGANYPQV